MSDASSSEFQRYDSIGGWLVFFGITLLIQLAFLVYSLGASMQLVLRRGVWHRLTSPDSPSYHPLWAPLLLLDVIRPAVLLVFLGCVLWAFLRRRRHAPAVIIAFLMTSATLAGILHLLRLKIPDVASKVTVTQSGRLAWSIMLTAIWIGYFRVSKRVEGTFLN